MEVERIPFCGKYQEVVIVFRLREVTHGTAIIFYERAGTIDVFFRHWLQHIIVVEGDFECLLAHTPVVEVEAVIAIERRPITTTRMIIVQLGIAEVGIGTLFHTVGDGDSGLVVAPTHDGTSIKAATALALDGSLEQTAIDVDFSRMTMTHDTTCILIGGGDGRRHTTVDDGIFFIAIDNITHQTSSVFATFYRSLDGKVLDDSPLDIGKGSRKLVGATVDVDREHVGYVW